jgi:hypothetical protein
MMLLVSGSRYLLSISLRTLNLTAESDLSSEKIIEIYGVLKNNLRS